MGRFRYAGTPPPSKQKGNRFEKDAKAIRFKKEPAESGMVTCGVNRDRLKNDDASQDRLAEGYPLCGDGLLHLFKPLPEHAQPLNEYQQLCENDLAFGETRELEVAPIGCPRVEAYLSKEVGLLDFLEESEPEHIHRTRGLTARLEHAWRKIQGLARRLDSNIRESLGHKSPGSSLHIPRGTNKSRPHREENRPKTSSSLGSPSQLQSTLSQRISENLSPINKPRSYQSTVDSREQVESLDNEVPSNEYTLVDEPNERDLDRNDFGGGMEHMESCRQMKPGEWFSGRNSTTRKGIERGYPFNTERLLEGSNKVDSMGDTYSEEDSEAPLETWRRCMSIGDGFQGPTPRPMTPERAMPRPPSHDADTLGRLEGTKSPAPQTSPYSIDVRKLGRSLNIGEHTPFENADDALAKLEGRSASPPLGSRHSFDCGNSCLSLSIGEHIPFEDADDALAKLIGRSSSPPPESPYSFDCEKSDRSLSIEDHALFKDAPDALAKSEGRSSSSPLESRRSLDRGKMACSLDLEKDISSEAENGSLPPRSPQGISLVLESATAEELHLFGSQPSRDQANGSLEADNDLQADPKHQEFPLALILMSEGSGISGQAPPHRARKHGASGSFETDNDWPADLNPQKFPLALGIESAGSEDSVQVPRQASQDRATGSQAIEPDSELSSASTFAPRSRQLPRVPRSAKSEESHEQACNSGKEKGRFPVNDNEPGGWISRGPRGSVIPSIPPTINDYAIPLQLTEDPIFSPPDGRYAFRLPVVSKTANAYDQSPWPTPFPHIYNLPYQPGSQFSQERAPLYRGCDNYGPSGLSSTSRSGFLGEAAWFGPRRGMGAVSEVPSQGALSRRLQREQREAKKGAELSGGIMESPQGSPIQKISAGCFLNEPRTEPAGQCRPNEHSRWRVASDIDEGSKAREGLSVGAFEIENTVTEYGAEGSRGRDGGWSYDGKQRVHHGRECPTSTVPDRLRHKAPVSSASCLDTEANEVVSASASSAWGTGHQPRLQVPQKAHIAPTSRSREIPIGLQQRSLKPNGSPRSPYLVPIAENSAQPDHTHLIYDPLNPGEHRRLRKHQQHQEELAAQAALYAESETERSFFSRSNPFRTFQSKRDQSASHSENSLHPAEFSFLARDLDSSNSSIFEVETAVGELISLPPQAKKSVPRVTFGALPSHSPIMDGRLRVTQSETTLAKAKAMEDARQMQAQVNDMCLKERREPPPWALIELIGKGSFGRVYKGKNMSTAQVVAVKTIDMDAADRENPRQADSYADFLKEFETLKALRGINAKNINHVIAAEPVGTTLWLVTEHCAGGSLATLMKPTHPRGLQEKWVIPIVREVAVGIKWCHQAGIIHRDLKCANVLVAEDGGVQICDFGVAGMLEGRSDKRTTIIGTPHWMAPELFKNSANYGKEVDIWAFGAMIFELATGSPPHVKQGLLSFEDIGQWLSRNVPRLEEDGYSESLQNLVACLLEELPQERPTIEQVQMHPYISNSESAYPTSGLTNLVAAFQQWMDHGGSRKSLFMAGGAQRQEVDSNPNAPELIEEWNFSTTQAFSNRVSQHINPQDVIDAYGENIIDFDTAKPSKTSRRRPPPQALLALKNPLVKVFDPDTITNYKAHSEDYYGVRPQQYQSENLPTSDLPLRDDSVRVHIQGTMIDLGGHDMDTGLSSFPDMDTIKAGGRGNGQDEGYSATSDFHRPALSDPADINPNRRTQDWKFPSFAPPASADPETSRFPTSSHELPRPTITPGAGGRPALVHHPTEPLGGNFNSGLLPAGPPANDRRSMAESLIDLDMGLADPYPEITRPSTANSEAGSATSEQLTSGNPFEFERHVSYQAPLETSHSREPSVYFDDPRIDLDISNLRDPRESRIDLDAAMTPPRDLQDVRDIADISDFSEIEQGGPDPNEASRYDPAGYSDTEFISMPPPPRPSNANPTYTMAHFPSLPVPPSAAALAGAASRQEMTDEIHRALGSLTGQLEAFRDVYESPALARSANRGIRR